MHFLTLPWKLIFALIPPTGKSSTRYRHLKLQILIEETIYNFYYHSFIIHNHTHQYIQLY